MKTNIKIISSLLGLGSLLLYIIGLSYLFGYYNEVNIDITKYINLSDLIFSAFYVILDIFLPLILVVVIWLFLSLYLALFIIPSTRNKSNRDNSKNEEFTFSDIAILFLMLGYLVSIIKFRHESWRTALVTFYFLFIIYSIYITSKEAKISRGWVLGSSLFIFLVIIFLSSLLGGKDSNLAKDGIIEKHVNFYEQGVLYNTKSDSLKYIGETNAYLFLYNNTSDETFVFNKSRINKLKFSSIEKEN